MLYLIIQFQILDGNIATQIKEFISQTPLQIDIAKELCFSQEKCKKSAFKGEGVPSFHPSFLILVGMKTWWLKTEKLSRTRRQHGKYGQGAK